MTKTQLRRHAKIILKKRREFKWICISISLPNVSNKKHHAPRKYIKSEDIGLTRGPLLLTQCLSHEFVVVAILGCKANFQPFVHFLSPFRCHESPFPMIIVAQALCETDRVSRTIQRTGWMLGNSYTSEFRNSLAAFEQYRILKSLVITTTCSRRRRGNSTLQRI